jgi:hypothetical protein
MSRLIERYYVDWDEAARQVFVTYALSTRYVAPSLLDDSVDTVAMEVVFRCSELEVTSNPHAVAERIRQAGLPFETVMGISAKLSALKNSRKLRAARRERDWQHNRPEARLARQLPDATEAELAELTDGIDREGLLQMVSELEQIGHPEPDDEDPIGSEPRST